MNEIHHANLADREGARSRMEHEGHVRPCCSQPGCSQHLPEFLWLLIGSVRQFPLAFGGGALYSSSKGLTNGVSQSQLGNLG